MTNDTKDQAMAEVSNMAARSRRHRERRRAGVIVLRVEVDHHGLTEAAIEAGMIVEDDDSRDALERTAAEILSEWQKFYRHA